MIKNILIFIILILIIIFHLAFLPNFSWWNDKLSLLIIFIGLVAIKQEIKMFAWIILAGFIIDCFSGSFFPSYLVAFSITGLIIFLLSKKVFSHQTLISTIFLVGIVATISVFIVLAIVNFFISISDLSNYWFSFKNLLVDSLWQLILNTIIAVLIILITTFFKNKFSNRFIINYGQ